MTFPSSSQAQNEPESAGRKIGLIGVWNDGWIEKGSGFQRVFRQEVRSDQLLPLLGQLRIKRQGLTKLLKAFQEEFADLQVSEAEFSADFVKEPADLIFRYCYDSGNYSGNPLGATRSEGPQQNAGLVGMENCCCAAEVNGHYIRAANPRMRSVP